MRNQEKVEKVIYFCNLFKLKSTICYNFGKRAMSFGKRETRIIQ